MKSIAKATVLTALSLCLSFAVIGDGKAVPTVPPNVLKYRVKHAVYGDIGSYSNTIEHEGNQTIVETRVHLKVSVLGIVMHREDAERTERWQDGRLVYFHGVTTKNGDKIEVQGEAQGDRFVIATPKGTVTAPADIHPANPWSGDCIHSDTMMRVDSGAVEKVRVSGGAPSAVKVADETVPTREYQIDGEVQYKIWLDDRNVPVRFSVDDPSGLVTFALDR
jgi:hypothetical protein